MSCYSSRMLLLEATATFLSSLKRDMQQGIRGKWSEEQETSKASGLELSAKLLDLSFHCYNLAGREGKKLQEKQERLFFL